MFPVDMKPWRGGCWWFAGAVLSGLDLLQNGKRFKNWSLCLGFNVEWAESISSGFAYNRGLVYCMCQESWVYMLWGCLTEQRTRETCWTKSKGKREDKKHPLRPVYQTWAVLNQFKTLFSTWQTLHIFLVSTDLPKPQYNSHNLSNLWSISLTVTINRWANLCTFLAV